MITLKAKAKATGRNPDGYTFWEAQKGELVSFTPEEAKRRMAIEPGKWEEVKTDGGSNRRKR